MFEHLKHLIRRHLFRILNQAMICEKVVAHRTISPMRKDVFAKCSSSAIIRRKFF